MSINTIKQIKSNDYSALKSHDKYLINEFEQNLSNNFSNSRSVKYYAEQLAITPRKLNQLIKSYSKTTAKDYIEEKIILESKILLKGTSNSIKQISQEMGFTEPTNFNKFFKKLTSITPLRYREINNKGIY